MAKSPRSCPLRMDEVERLRQLKGWSKEQLAAKIGVSTQAVNKWYRKEQEEKGKAETYHKNVTLLAQAFGVERETLVEGYQPPPLPAPPVKDQRSVNFEGMIKFKGKMIGLADAGKLQKIAQDFADALAAQGITITAYQSLIILDDMTRVIVLVYGLLENGDSFWVFVAVKPSKYRAFLVAQEDGSLDLYKFDPWGEILISGDGKMPPQDVIAVIANAYQCAPEDLFKPADGQRKRE